MAQLHTDCLSLRRTVRGFFPLQFWRPEKSFRLLHPSKTPGPKHQGLWNHYKEFLSSQIKHLRKSNLQKSFIMLQPIPVWASHCWNPLSGSPRPSAAVQKLGQHRVLLGHCCKCPEVQHVCLQLWEAPPKSVSSWQG